MRRHASGYENLFIGSVPPQPNLGSIAIGQNAGYNSQPNLGSIAIGYSDGYPRLPSNVGNIPIGYRLGYSATGDPLIVPSNSISFTGPLGPLLNLPLRVNPEPPLPSVRKPIITDKPASSPETQCPICMENAKRTVFQCGHMTCNSCSEKLETCAHCRAPITLRIPVFD